MEHMNNRRIAILTQIIIAVAILLMCSPAAYAEPEDDTSFSMSVPGVRLLTLERDTIQFGPDSRQMLDGRTHQEVLIALVSANVSWVLTIRGSAELWEAPWDKPVSDIYWKYGGGDYESLSTQSAAVVAGGPSNQRTYPIDFRIKLDLEKDVPGEYYYEYVMFELAMP